MEPATEAKRQDLQKDAGEGAGSMPDCDARLIAWNRPRRRSGRICRRMPERAPAACRIVMQGLSHGTGHGGEAAGSAEGCRRGRRQHAGYNGKHKRKTDCGRGNASNDTRFRRWQNSFLTVLCGLGKIVNAGRCFFPEERKLHVQKPSKRKRNTWTFSAY